MRMLRLFTRKATFSDGVLDLVLTNEDVRDDSCGIEDGYWQEPDSAVESYIPDFDLTGVDNE